MPLATSASAAPLISGSLTLHWNLFQLFQPMGGVSARPSPALAGATAAGSRAATTRGRTRRMESLRRGRKCTGAAGRGDESDGSGRGVAGRTREPPIQPRDDFV